MVEVALWNGVFPKGKNLLLNEQILFFKSRYPPRLKRETNIGELHSHKIVSFILALFIRGILGSAQFTAI